jgi:hypothetical protein
VTTQETTIEAVKNQTEANYTAQTFHPQHAIDMRDQEWEARIQAHKLEQKQHLAELFEQIKTLDSQRLEEYKVWQNEGIEHLRERIARQQELIEELMLRNKEAYEMREASMQRQQTSREQLLDRI